MPRSGPVGTYSLPGAQKTQVPDTPIPSAVNNQGYADIEQTFNTPTPIAYGGTNAGTEAQARTNLGLQIGVNIPSVAQANMIDRRNRVVNGDKLVSQENAQTSGTTNGRYISDQNAMYFVSSAGVFTGVNVQTLSPAGGYRDRITITTADASLAAGEYLTYSQNIEGSNIRDAKWGTAGAVPIIVRRGFKFPAGTYTVAFHNSGLTRSYVTSFVVSGGEANTDIVREFAIPGDTTGTWLSADGVIGLVMDVVIAAGTTFQTTANAWQAGNFLTVSGSTNGIGTAAAVFEFFDEGLKLDPDATGSYGVYQAGEVDTVFRSERYLFAAKGSEPFPGVGQLTGTSSLFWNIDHNVIMAKPTTLLSFNNIVHSISTGTFFAVSNIVLSAGGVRSTRLSVTSSQAGFTAGTVTVFGGGGSTSSLFLSARI